MQNKKIRIINGIKYYTSSYISEKLGITERQARTLLSKYKCLNGYKRPRLYPKSEIDNLLYDYRKSKNLDEDEFENIVEERRMKKSFDKLSEISINSTASTSIIKDFNLFDIINFTNEKNTQLPKDKINKEFEKRYSQELIIKMLEILLDINNIEFNKELFEKDLKENIIDEKTEKSSNESISEALKRFKNPHSYIIKKNKW